LHLVGYIKYTVSTACIYFCALSADWPQSFHSHSAIVDVRVIVTIHPPLHLVFLDSCDI